MFGGAADAVTESSTNTFTNKTIDANGTGNSITNIENADIAAAAAIALSKLASGTDAQLIVANASGVPTYVSQTGDVTFSNTGAAAIAAGAIVNADVSATAAIAASKLASIARVIASAQGSTTTTTDVELATVTFAANDFAANDLCVVVVQINNTAGANTPSYRIRAADGTNTFTGGDISANRGANTLSHGITFLSQAQAATTTLGCSTFAILNSGIFDTGTMVSNTATMIANWITSAFTLSLRSTSGVASTTYFKWWVLKIQV